jgi:hypothetical protein
MHEGVYRLTTFLKHVYEWPEKVMQVGTYVACETSQLVFREPLFIGQRPPEGFKVRLIIGKTTVEFHTTFKTRNIIITQQLRP